MISSQTNLLFLVAAGMIALGVALILRAIRRRDRERPMPICPNAECRFRNRSGARYCARCGRRLDARA